MTVTEAVKRREITEVLHFTQYRGLTGSLHARLVKSRAQLMKDHELKYIFEPNSMFRKDQSWLNFVNLSISEINSWFFEFSKKWHPEDGHWWCILAFDPEILSHDGVVFTTTNNIYPSVRRAKGGIGLEAMFADSVIGRYSRVTTRPKNLPLYVPTDEQAEVLYPDALGTNYIRKIYVATEEDADDVHGQFRGIGHDAIEVIVQPGKFKGWKP